MTMGTQSKPKVVFLAVLMVVMAYVLYDNVLAGPDTPSRPAPRPAAASTSPTAPGAVGGSTPTGPPPAKRAGSRVRSQEFHPVYLDPNPAKRRDPRTIDPTLRTDLFAKVQGVELAGGARNLFQFAAAPPPPAAAAKPAGEEPKIAVVVGPRQSPPPPPPAPPPPPPPITLKFYGFSTSAETGKKTAYLLDGEDIYLAAEGDTLKRRYKIIRIGPSSILVEDLDAKRQQSLPLLEENAG